ncbi:intracellular hyaluronan-binding protein 4-like [Clinocottus analis]|uniref:intracellular hyaluronan-binding protein 4-like n=1 Tax=Clinocottus analis TaxID=304258 RepID=UPI0035C091D6
MFTEAERHHKQAKQNKTKMLPEAYGCAVANRYGELLDDEADPFDLISKVQMEKEKKKKQDGEKKGKRKKSGQKESQKERRLPVVSEVQDPAPVRQLQQVLPGPVTERADGREEAFRATKRAAFGERWSKEEDPQEFSISKPSYNADSNFKGRGGNRGGGRGRGRDEGGYSRNSDNLDLRGKRGYDRQSATGISPEEKRGGRRPWIWGGVEESAKNESMEVISDSQVKSEEPQTHAMDENPNRAMEEETGEVLVQVAMEMTLDEWKALQETSRPKAEFNIRKSGNQIPSKAKVIHKSKHVEKEGIMEEGEDEGHFLRRSVNDITSLLDINFGSLGRPSRGGRGRGARGSPATRPERAKPTLEREDYLAPNPDDPEDFPALSAGR